MLAWVTFDACYEVAELGDFDGGDGVRFHLTFQGTCRRRGRHRLLIEVAAGPGKHLWGCVDDADQPMRYYFSAKAAKEEADRWASVLYEDRREAGKPSW